MTDKPEFKKTWRIAEGGALLGTIDIVSPWTGGPTEAVVNIDTMEVIAAHGATCVPFLLIVPQSIMGEVKKVTGITDADNLEEYPFDECEGQSENGRRWLAERGRL